MNKQEFLKKLQASLLGLPEKEMQDSLGFYSEMIDDRMEEGLSEEDAVRDIGSAEEIAGQIIAETPLITIVKEKIKPKRKIQAWEIVLLILGAPIWLSLLIAAFAVILSLYVSFWAIIISFWAVFASLISVALCGIGVGIGLIWNNNILTAIMLISAGLICAGLSVFCFYGCKAATQGAILLAKKLVIGIKNRFMKKEKTA